MFNIPVLNSLRGKLTVLFTLFVVFTALLLSINDYRYVRNMLRNNIEQQLTLSVQGLSNILLAYVQQQQERAVLISSRTRLRMLVAEYLAGSITSGPFLEQTRQILGDARNSTDSFFEITIADPSGTIITSTEPGLIGHSIDHQPAFQYGLVEPSLGLPRRTDGGLRSRLSAPIRANEGHLLGVMLVDTDASHLESALSSIPSKFESYTVRVAALRDSKIRYLFPIGEDDSDITADLGDDPVMLAALEGFSGFEALTDESGTVWLAAYKNVGYQNWGLVAEVNEDDAYASIAELRGVMALAAVLVALLGIGIGVRVATGFTGPIGDLTAVATRVAAGDLNARAREDSGDEVGLMATAFNNMTSVMQRHQNELEDLVQERTRVLEERTAQLTSSHSQLEDLVRLLEEQAEITERDLKRAEQIQRSLLPAKPPTLHGFCIQTLYRPGHSVGGDLYDVITIDQRYLALVVADASGHGVSAAMLAVLFKHRLQQLGDSHAGSPFSPAEALRNLNRKLMGDVMTPGVFFTCVYGLLDAKTNELLLASAGHPPSILLRYDGTVDQFSNTGPALGLYDEVDYRDEVIRLNRGDRVLLYTDGLFDVGVDRGADSTVVATSFQTHRNETELLEQVFYDVSGGTEPEDRDDVTMLLLEVSERQSEFNATIDDSRLTVLPTQEASQITWVDGPSDGQMSAHFLCIKGRVSWTYGETLLAAAQAQIESDKTLIIDLTECEYLDSTMLGTLHELVRMAEDRGTSVHLQGVSAPLLEAFDELSMDNVIRHVHQDAVAVPERQQPLLMIDTDPRRQHGRLLKAHEELAALSDHNRDQFNGVIEELRAESSS
ncbi:MAG: SpoIIE family protein phosphatase [Proteobacteria bacterium]|nr:SpoIIE family protein phosphatase [Pseudomonadota bacterium]MDA1298955.1 SpoIIE family protein phosphatase [Pseudomonadota bacterium]